MNIVHKFSLRTIAIGALLVTLSHAMADLAIAQEVRLSAKMIQDRDYPSTSNTRVGRKILANAPTEAPGYRQFMGFIFSVMSGDAKTVPLKPAVPNDVSAIPDLTYQTIDNKELKLDLYRPRTMVEAAPLVVLVHGGCWMDGTRKEMAYYAIKLAQLGYVTASVSYRLSEEAPYPAAIVDLRDAIKWLTTHSDTYDIDPSRVALMGGSAGGHLVEYLGYTANTPGQDHPEGIVVKAIIPFYGWSDLTEPSVSYQYYMELFLGQKYSDAPDLYSQASPITYVDKGDPATLLLHGTIDTIVPINQSEKLAKKLAASDVPYIYAPFKGGYHGYDFFEEANPGVLYLIEAFLDEYLNN